MFFGAWNRRQSLFLASEQDRPWMLGPRERLRRRFVAAAGKLAEVLAREGQHDLAIALCDKALDQDPTAEAIHRQIMSAHLALGRRAEALAAYRRCRESLAAAMRLAPSGETEALRRQAERAD